MLRKTFGILTFLILALAFASTATASPVYSYAVKFVCGYNPTNVGLSLNNTKEGEPTVKFGNYATDVNIVNASLSTTADLKKRVILLVKEGFPSGREPKVQGVAAEDSITLKPLEGTMDDCNRIWELLSSDPPPNPYPLMIGFLIIQSPIELDVTAVYTAETCANWVNSPRELECLDRDGRFTDASVSIDVDQITGRPVF